MQAFLGNSPFGTFTRWYSEDVEVGHLAHHLTTEGVTVKSFDAWSLCKILLIEY
jgi:hypothetical protein